MKNSNHIHDALLSPLAGQRRTTQQQTRRQQKHDMFLKFMDNASRPKPQPPKKRPALLSTLLSIFF